MRSRFELAPSVTHDVELQLGELELLEYTLIQKRGIKKCELEASGVERGKRRPRVIAQLPPVERKTGGRGQKN